MDPRELAVHAGLWLRTLGPEADVVLSTRVRLARNVDGYAFPSRIAPDVRRDLETRLHAWIGDARLAPDVRYWNLDALPEITCLLLMERHLVSRELVMGRGDRGVSFVPTESVSVMSNEEDHLRIQVVRSGYALSEAFAAALEVDKKLESRIPYAWHERYGFLTSCPTNVGTGLRISVMMHLPALMLMNQMDKVYHATSKVGLTVRGFYGEGTKAIGDVIQISNQQTLGSSEDQILETIQQMVPKIVEYERGVRQHLLSEKRSTVEDKVWRSVGLLRYARKLSSEETMTLLSALRLGVNLKIIPDITVSDVNELFVITQPGHLQTLEGKELLPDDRDVARASLLRKRLKPESN